MTVTAAADLDAGYGMRLLPQHQTLLRDSAVTPEVAAARGYVSVDTKQRLIDLGFADYQARVPGLLIPVHDVGGNVATYQYRPDEPRNKAGKPIKYETPAGSRIVVDCPPAVLDVLGDPAQPLIVTEGARKADAAVSAGAACIDLLGVWNWLGRNDKGGKTALPCWRSIALNGRLVMLAFDSDAATKPAVRQALDELAVFLASKGANVQTVALPMASNGDKVGLDDWLAAGNNIDDLHDLATPHEPLAALGFDGPPIMPTIEVGNRDLPEVTADAQRALLDANKPPRVFQNGATFVRVAVDDEGARLDTLTRPGLRGELARVALWRRTKKTRDGDVQLHVAPPLEVVDDLATRPHVGLPRLISVVRSPVLAPDGTIHAARGYHPSTATWYEPVNGFTLPAIPDQPTAQHIDEARGLILEELLGDFPFAGDEAGNAEQAHALALVLLPFVRGCIDGPTPLHLAEASTPGTGKGLLAQAALYPALGEPAPTRPAVTDEEEWRKLITSLLMRGQQVALFDNLRHPLDSGQLAAALTATKWEDRQLGVNRDVVLPVRTIWAATGNNPVTSTEIARRTVRIRLDANTERPWERIGYKHPHLLDWARTNRAELAAAALTLAKAWVAQDRPGPAAGTPSFGGFEAWRHTIGGILHVAEVGGFLDNRTEQYDASDGEHAAWAALIDEWWNLHQDRAVTVAQLWPLIIELDGFDLGDDGDKSQRTRFGNQLRAQRDRIIGGRRIIDTGTYKGAKTYRLAPRTAAQ